MGLGIKTILEEKELELLSDEDYCLRMVTEVSRYLPAFYAGIVHDVGKEYGVNIDLEEIRRVKVLQRKNRTVAFLINKVGQMYKK
jgi:hypothetical protein